MSTKNLSKFLLGSGLVITLMLSFASMVSAQGVTICHATGSATNPYTTLNLPTVSTGGHFDNNGTPQSGHEDDILNPPGGVCPTGGPAEVPEPITMLLFGAGLAGVGYAAKRRKARTE